MIGDRTRRVLAWAGVVVLVLLCAGLAGWRTEGGRWVRVETASMGTQAPVGSLLWIRPVRFESLRAGDLVAFRSPDGVLYSHLVKTVHPDGTLTTQGRISAPDPWRTGPEDVVGRTAMVWPGVGWLVQALPVLLLGGVLVALLVRAVRERRWRLPVAMVGVSLVVAVALVVYRPLTRADQLSFVPEDGTARATYVSTGLVPIRLSGYGAAPVRLRDGEVGSVVTRERHGRYQVAVDPDVPLGWWLALVAVCFLPVAGRLHRPSRERASKLAR